MTFSRAIIFCKSTALVSQLKRYWKKIWAIAWLTMEAPGGVDNKIQIDSDIATFALEHVCLK
jgi:hypothetical protein